MREPEVHQSCKSSAFVAPSTVLVSGATPDQGTFAFFTPIDSHRTIGYIGNFDVDWTTPQESAEARRFMSLDPETLGKLGFSPETADRPDRARRVVNWYQDREGIRNGRFTGLPPFIPEDIIVAESMGSIYDRTEESLIPRGSGGRTHSADLDGHGARCSGWTQACWFALASGSLQDLLRGEGSEGRRSLVGDHDPAGI